MLFTSLFQSQNYLTKLFLHYFALSQPFKLLLFRRELLGVSFIYIYWNSRMAVLLLCFANILMHHEPLNVTSVLVLFVIFGNSYNSVVRIYR